MDIFAFILKTMVAIATIVVAGGLYVLAYVRLYWPRRKSARRAAAAARLRLELFLRWLRDKTAWFSPGGWFAYTITVLFLYALPGAALLLVLTRLLSYIYQMIGVSLPPYEMAFAVIVTSLFFLWGVSQDFDAQDKDDFRKRGDKHVGPRKRRDEL